MEDLEDRTDAEVFRAMDELRSVQHEEHFTPAEGQVPLLENYTDLAILPRLPKGL